VYTFFWATLYIGRTVLKGLKGLTKSLTYYLLTPYQMCKRMLAFNDSIIVNDELWGCRIL